MTYKTTDPLSRKHMEQTWTNSQPGAKARESQQIPTQLQIIHRPVSQKYMIILLSHRVWDSYIDLFQQ